MRTAFGLLNDDGFCECPYITDLRMPNRQHFKGNRLASATPQY